jgi:hypothetical protein
MAFDSKAPAFQILQLGDVARGKLDLRGSAFGAGDVRLALVLSTPKEGTRGPQEAWRREVALALDGREAKPIAVTEELPIADKGNMLHMLAEDTTTRRVLLDQVVQFDRLPPAPAPAPAAPAPRAEEKPKLGLLGAWLPRQEMLRVQANFGGFGELEPLPASVAVSVAPAGKPDQQIKTLTSKLDPASVKKPPEKPAGGETKGPAAGEVVLDLADMVSRRVEAPKVGVTIVEVPLGKLQDGDYLVRTRLLDAAGKELGAAEGKFVKKSYSWEKDNTLGVSAKVIEPWTPMQADGNKVRCWGREHELAGSGLFAHVRAQRVAKPLETKELLAAPIGFVVRAGGKETPLSSPAEPPQAQVSPTGDRVSWRGSVEGGPVAIGLKAQMDYDGCTVYELTLRPTGGKPSRA